MPDLTLFKIIVLISAIITLCIRLWFKFRYSASGPVMVDRHDLQDRVLVFLAMTAMVILPSLFIFTPILDGWNYALPHTLAWFGVPILAATNILLWKVHYDLGAAWSARLEIQDGHKLVEHGLYASIRHPMYTGVLLGGIGQALLLHNWIAGPATLIVGILFVIFRVPQEERMLLDHFGDAYRSYMKRTGRIFPKIFPIRSRS